MVYSKQKLANLIKAYDIRGKVTEDLTPDFVKDVGRVFAQLVRRENETKIIVAHDMRDSARDLVPAFVTGVIEQGIDVINIGLAATDELYFASGFYNLPGAMFTASHNPAVYNGIKFCRAEAKPIGQNTGLDFLTTLLSTAIPPQATVMGNVTKVDLIDKYADFLLELVDLSSIKKMKIIVDAGNGMAGYTVPKILGKIKQFELVDLYFELDGNFPNHEANPMDLKNIAELRKLVVREKADLGLAFDGDADRCFFIDETGAPVTPSVIVALIARLQLEKHPGATIIHNLVTSKIVPETIAAANGISLMTRVGHSFIKQKMAETGAIFGGEHSAHYYFKDFWFADSGMLAALSVIEILGKYSGNMSTLIKPFQKYFNSGELNTLVSSPQQKINEIITYFSNRIANKNEIDGLTINLNDGSWFNLRLSNTEPLLRLNAEADSEIKLNRLIQEIQEILN